ncbi:MAG TPA: hypothetical protein VMS92_18960 [Mycobacterium sp.]|nr:hypothetical protein [Mycobacterium sp.]
MAPGGLPILCLDFDGVIHDYKHGWRNGEIYGHLTHGFFEWAQEAHRHFTLVIYSSRSKDDDGVEMMAAWLVKELGKTVVRRSYRNAENRILIDIGGIEFQFAHEKPPAFLTIDDRAVCFKGDWSELEPAKLRKFTPWMSTE